MGSGETEPVPKGSGKTEPVAFGEMETASLGLGEMEPAPKGLSETEPVASRLGEMKLMALRSRDKARGLGVRQDLLIRLEPSREVSVGIDSLALGIPNIDTRQ